MELYGFANAQPIKFFSTRYIANILLNNNKVEELILQGTDKFTSTMAAIEVENDINNITEDIDY